MCDRPLWANFRRSPSGRKRLSEGRRIAVIGEQTAELLDLPLFHDLQRVVDLDPEVTNSAC